MTNPTQHCQRPWWKRPPVWLLAVVLLGALAYVVAKEAGRPAAMTYGAFLDQVEAGNVASASRIASPTSASPVGRSAALAP